MFEELRESIELNKKIVLKYCQDKTIPQWMRWNAASENQWAFGHENYVIHFLDEYHKKGEIPWYDDFYIDRYATVNLFDLLADDWTEEESENFELPFEENEYWTDVSAVKERVLQSGLCSFDYDW